MSRLALVPPHLMDMPSIGMSRVIPPQISLPDPLSLASDLPVYDVNLNNWDGTRDGPEQELEATAVYDFENYYPDEEFWGVSAAAGNDNPRTLIRRGINAAGQLVVIATYPVPMTGWPNGPFTSVGGTFYFAYGNLTTAICRVNKDQIVVWDIVRSNNNGGYYPVFLVFNLNNGVPAQAGAYGPNNFGGGTSPDSQWFEPCMSKVSDKTVCVLTGNQSNNNDPTMRALAFSVQAGSATKTNDLTLGSGTLQFTGQLIDTMFVGNRRIIARGAYYNSNPVNSNSRIVTLDFPGDDSTIPAPTPTFGTSLGPADGKGTNDTLDWSMKLFVPLTSTRIVIYENSTRLLKLFSFGAGGFTLLSSVSINSVVATNTLPMSIARVNANEFVVVVQTTADNSSGKATTQRVFVNADNSMTYGPAYANYQSTPFKSGGASPSYLYARHRGLALPGNRILMQNRRNNSGNDPAFTKLLRAS